ADVSDAANTTDAAEDVLLALPAVTDFVAAGGSPPGVTGEVGRAIAVVAEVVLRAVVVDHEDDVPGGVHVFDQRPPRHLVATVRQPSGVTAGVLLAAPVVSVP